MTTQIPATCAEPATAPGRLLTGMGVLNGLQTGCTTVYTLIAIALLSADQRGLMVIGLLIGTTVGVIGSFGTGYALRALLPQQVDSSARRALVAAYTWFMLPATTAAAALAVGVGGVSAVLIDPRFARPGLLLAVTLVAVSQTLINQLTDALYADSHFRRGSSALLRAAVGSLVGVVIALAISRSAESALIGQSLGALVVLGELPALRRHRLFELRLLPKANTMWTLVRKGAPINGINLGSLVALRADRFVLGIWAPTASVGVYSLAAALSEAARVGTLGIAQVYLRDVAVGAGRRSLQRMTRLAVLAAVGTSIPVGIGGWLLIPTVFGSDYASARTLLPVLLLAEIAYTPYLVLSRGLLGGGWTVSAGLAGLVCGLGAVVCYVAGTALAGSSGLAAGSVVAYLLLSVVYGLLLHRRLRTHAYHARSERPEDPETAAAPRIPAMRKPAEGSGTGGRPVPWFRRRPPVRGLGGTGFGVITTLCWIGYVALVAMAVRSSATGAIAALVTVPLLLGVSVPVLAAIARRDPTPGILRLMVSSLVLKLAMAFVQLMVDRRVYGTLSDAQTYYDAGGSLARLWHSGTFSLSPVSETTQSGTRATGIFTGVVAYLVGPDVNTQFLTFSWIGFWGLVFFYLAYRTMFGDSKLFARAVFFLPSLLFWTSGIGKEACMTFLLGLAALGAARLMADRSGVVLLGSGLLGMAFIRPHVAALFFIALCISYLLRRRGASATRRPAPRRALVAVALVGGGVLLYSQLGSFFGTGNFSLAAGQHVYENVQTNNAATANIDAPTALSVTNLPWGLMTVLYRPFVFEAHNPVMLISALESLLLLVASVVAVVGRRKLMVVVARNPFLITCAIYVILFCLVFSGITNFGLLARQRIQILPFMLMVLCAVLGAPAGRETAPVAERDPGPSRHVEVGGRTANVQSG